MADKVIDSLANR